MVPAGIPVGLVVSSARSWTRDFKETLEPGAVVALSGSSRADGNVLYCFDDRARVVLTRRVAAPRKGAPRLMMIAGEALGWVQVLIDDGWVCVGATLAMRMSTEKVDPARADDPDVRRLLEGDMQEARHLFVQAYSVDATEAELMLPDGMIIRDGCALWGLEAEGELRSMVVTSDIDDATVIWSMSTPPQHQRRGYGRRLLHTVMARKRQIAIQDVLLFSSSAGRPLYRSLGFEDLEHWQEWSRPRWVFGRT
jgi:ribosomal protein S18 acetylase RimI-like enzyme